LNGWNKACLTAFLGGHGLIMFMSAMRHAVQAFLLHFMGRFTDVEFFAWLERLWFCIPTQLIGGLQPYNIGGNGMYLEILTRPETDVLLCIIMTIQSVLGQACGLIASIESSFFPLVARLMSLR
jgi:hypothetical protein